ncbi:MAG: CapA family protein [Desulfuromonadales bacterium]|nr:CapA family protein [Desulfuromonadales bacterium]
MSLNIIIGGDFYPGERAEPFAINDPSRLWGDLAQQISNADLRIINLECPLTVRGTPVKKTGPNLRAKPEVINCLSYAEIDIVTLANNHIYDYGEQGLLDTLDLCRENNIDTVGAHLSLKDSQQTFYKTIKGRTVSIVNFAENEWCNASDSHGGANPMDVIDNARQIKNAAEHSDIVLVIVHGGPDGSPIPTPRMVKQYRFYAEQGASAILGHHSHRATGYEVFNRTPIFYGLGNLMMPFEIPWDGWHEGMMVELSFDNENIPEFRIIPYIQSEKFNGTIRIMSESESTIFLKYLNDVSMIIQDPEKLNRDWTSFSNKNKNLYLSNLFLKSNFIRKVINKLGIDYYSENTSQLMSFLNFTRCESHRDSLILILENRLKNIKE